MKYPIAKRYVLQSVIIGGVSLTTMANLFADESILDPPIVPPTVLAPPSTSSSLPELPESPSPPTPSTRVASLPKELSLGDRDLPKLPDGAELNLTPEFDEAELGIADAEMVGGETIRERYENGAIKVERIVVQDENGNYVNHGPFKMFSPDGTLIAEGNFLMGTRNGTWRRVYATDEATLFTAYPYSEFKAPFVSQASFVADNLHGGWTITDAHGKTVSEIMFRDGLRHGQAVWNHPNGTRMYVANYNDGMLEGLMAEFNKDGQSLTEFTFRNGRRIEREVEHHKNQQVKAELTYLSAQQSLKERDDWWNAKPAVYETVGKRLKHGAFVEYHANGQKKSSGTYEDGRLTGDFASWFDNGQRETQGQYTLGTASGSWTWWHENGMRRAEGSYANGTPDGAWTSWTPDGKVAKRQTYSDAGKSVSSHGNQMTTRSRVSSQIRRPQR
ncbi:MAG: hypothetical protein R3C05_12805 [Pirellulaceae bacterium]